MDTDDCEVTEGAVKNSWTFRGCTTSSLILTRSDSRNRLTNSWRGEEKRSAECCMKRTASTRRLAWD